MMSTKSYIVVLVTLVICACIGSYWAFSVGESVSEVIKRLFVFIPALFISTMFWRIRSGSKL